MVMLNKKAITLFLYLVTFYATSTPQEYNTIHTPNIICVSLGWNCHVAENLRAHNIRHAAYPYDWNRTSFKGLCLTLKERFRDFFNLTYLRPQPTVCRVFNTKYDIAFCHDFPEIEYFSEKYVDYIPEIEEKYIRRINRFYTICDTADHVYFFRLAPHLPSLKPQWQHDIYQGKKHIEQLRNILLELFPQKNWTLVAVFCSDEYKNDWQLAHVRNFHMHETGGNSKQRWKEIFKQLEII